MNKRDRLKGICCYLGTRGYGKTNYELQKENQQLKEKDLIIAMELEKLQTENQQLKIQVSAREEVANKLQSTLEEIREYIEKDYPYINHDIPLLGKSEQLAWKVLQIIDKGE